MSRIAADAPSSRLIDCAAWLRAATPAPTTGSTLRLLWRHFAALAVSRRLVGGWHPRSTGSGRRLYSRPSWARSRPAWDAHRRLWVIAGRVIPRVRLRCAVFESRTSSSEARAVRVYPRRLGPQTHQPNDTKRRSHSYPNQGPTSDRESRHFGDFASRERPHT